MHNFYRSKVKVQTTSVRFMRDYPPFFRIWKWLVPQWILSYPKNKGYWTRQKFSCVPQGLEAQGRWEEFFVGNDPFAFHVGKVTYCGDLDDLSVARRIIANLVDNQSNKRITVST